MAPNSPHSPGNPAGGPPAPPLCPHSLNALLARDPARAAAILAAMRPALRAQQAQAHAALAGVDSARIDQEWSDLIARCGPLAALPKLPESTESPCASVYEPEALADLLVEQPALAHVLLRQLTGPQRVTQALAYAAFLSDHGMPVTLDEVLASWCEMEVRRAVA